MTPETPRPWHLLNHTCEHDVPHWITGPDPDALLAELGCDCTERGAA